MKRYRLRRWIALASACVLMVQAGWMSSTASAETIEKLVVRFSASDATISRLLSGSTFYTDWKTGDGLPSNTGNGKGADVSGTAANGAHKKMVLKTTVTLTALDPSVDVTTCWKQIGLRLRSATVDEKNYEADFYYLKPTDFSALSDTLDIAVPLSDIKAGSIDWSDVRQLNVTCEVTDTYKLDTTGDSDKIHFTLSNTRIVRELTDGEVDKDELKDLLEAVIQPDAYTPESVTVYTQAIEDGRGVFEAEDATQDQVDQAAAAIKAAKNGLVSSAVVYRQTLQTLLEESLPSEGFTEESVAVYQAALTAGQTVYAKEDATQKEVNDAVLAIMAAKLNRVSVVSDEQFETLLTFSGSNRSWSYLNSGKNFYTDWKTGDGLTDQNSAEPGIDVSGTADNGSDARVYLQMQVAYTALSASAAPAACWKQIGLRLRSSAVDGQEQAAGFYYVKADTVTADEGGVYTIRIPLRAMDTQNINWADVKQLNILSEVTDAYALKNDDGSERPGDSLDIGFTLGQVSLVKKNVYSKGDVDGNGTVEAADALLALQAATGKITLHVIQQEAADVDGTSGVAANDALIILQAATGKIGSLEQEEKKMVAFTFDDGPSENTAALLDALKERGVHATFFVIGKQAEQHPDLVARMAAEGHEVGNHSYSHDGINITGRDEMIADYGKCSDLIEQYTGKRPTLMRAVGGTSVEAISDYVKEQGLRLCGWMGGGDDYNQTDKDVVVNFYMKDGECTISDGDLILLHENHASSVEAALELIDMLLADGYACVTVQELLNARADGGTPGTSYSRVIDLS